MSVRMHYVTAGDVVVAAPLGSVQFWLVTDDEQLVAVSPEDARSHLQAAANAEAIRLVGELPE